MRREKKAESERGNLGGKGENYARPFAVAEGPDHCGEDDGGGNRRE
jgi:hypothetical protein